MLNKAMLNTAATRCLPVCGHRVGCSFPCRLSEGLGPASLLLSRKDAEPFCSGVQLPGSTGEGRVAMRGLPWLAKPVYLTLSTVAWAHQRVTAAVPWKHSIK